MTVMLAQHLHECQVILTGVFKITIELC
ncbi:uncharacterized protein METZ01_LOCUS226686, partial [marine metagenome]